MHAHDTDDNSKIARISRNSEWLPIGAALRDHVTRWAGENDLVLYIGLDGAQDLGEDAATAFYDPRDRSIEVSATYALGPGADASRLDAEALKTRKGLSDYPVLGGVLLHESMHAKHSTAFMPDVAKEFERKYGRNVGSQAMKVYILLEELRIESRGIREWKRDAGYLRASARKISSPAPTKDGEPEQAPDVVTAVLLVLMRERIGVLKPRDIMRLRSEVEKQVEPSVLDEVWKHVEVFIRQNDGLADSREVMIEQAKSVYDLLADNMQKVEMSPDGSEGEGGEGVPSPDGEGGTPMEGSPDGKLSESAASAMESALDSAEMGGSTDVWSQASQEEAQRKAEEEAKRAEDQKENDKKSNNTFERSHATPGATRSRATKRRAPTERERRAVVTFSGALADAKYRDRAVAKMSSVIPPGRLNTGAAMRDEAARFSGNGGNRPAMFKYKRRTHVESPDLTVGIMGDISGSMGGTMAPMASATWIMANSVNRIAGAKVAGVNFGQSVYPTLWPGQKQDQVTEYSASDGSEAFDDGFRSLDGKLKLLNGHGVRLLVVCSDGNYRSPEEKACRNWLAECRRAGVGVLWIGLKQGRAEGYISEMGRGGEFVQVGEDVSGAIGAISQAALKALRGY